MFWSKSGARQAALALRLLATLCTGQTVSRAFRLVYILKVYATHLKSLVLLVSREVATVRLRTMGSGTWPVQRAQMEIHISPHATHKHSNNSVAGLSFEYEPPGVIEHSSVGEAGQTAHEEETIRQMLPVSTCYLSRLA